MDKGPCPPHALEDENPGTVEWAPIGLAWGLARGVALYSPLKRMASSCLATLSRRLDWR
jgi:hypothetical protein